MWHKDWELITPLWLNCGYGALQICSTYLSSNPGPLAKGSVALGHTGREWSGIFDPGLPSLTKFLCIGGFPVLNPQLPPDSPFLELQNFWAQPFSSFMTPSSTKQHCAWLPSHCPALWNGFFVNLLGFPVFSATVFLLGPIWWACYRVRDCTDAVVLCRWIRCSREIWVPWDRRN